MVRFLLVGAMCLAALGACAPQSSPIPQTAPEIQSIPAEESTAAPATRAQPTLQAQTPLAAATQVAPTPAAKALSTSQYLAFASDRDNTPGIYLLALDTLETKRLTDKPLDASHPAWSPDGASIAFDARVDGREEMFVMRADGSELQQLTQDMGDNFYPSWSPDSQWLAIASNREGPYQIYVMRADGGQVRRISDGTTRAEKPAWSRDGQEIAYMLQKDGNVDIYVTRVDNLETRRLTTHPGSDFNPAWSPDGNWIAFNSSRAGQHQLFLMPADGSNVRQLTRGRGWSEKPAWSPDGNQIAFYSNRDGNAEVYVMDVSTEADVTNPGETSDVEARRLTTHAGFDGQPTWAVAKKSALAECPVTKPPGPAFIPPPPHSAVAPYGEFWYGTNELWTMLMPNGVWEQLPGGEGGYSQKTFWWREGYDWQKEPTPDLTVTGRRLDADAPPLTAYPSTNGFHSDLQSFMLVGVEIPTKGCWEITGKTPTHALSFVVLVK